MKKVRYKDQNKKNYKKILIVLFVLIFISLLALSYLDKIENNEEIEIEYEEISTIKEVIEYHKSRYISEKTSDELDYYLDIYVEFAKPLYEEEKSNEKYFNKLIEDAAKVLGYYSYKLIDNKNNIVIKVIGDRTKVKKIIINDMEDYFIYTDSQNSLKQYKEIPITNFSIKSEVLQRCIDSNWSSDVYLGERDSIFNSYYIFFDEGIKARIINGKIYNIIFTDKYQGDVIEDISTHTGKEYINTCLGKPTFQNDELGIYGYKGEKIYVFFSENEISIYRNSSIDSDDFFDLTERYINKELDLLDFMNELTYLWPDYTEYIYDEQTVYITYPLKGVEISINYGDINGILVYNNNKSTMSKISRYLENTIFVSRLQVDLVYQAEQKRIEDEIDLINKCDEFANSLNDVDKKRIGNSMKYKIYPKRDVNGYISKIYFISSFNNEPNRELNDGISSFLWINNDYFLFSKSEIGVYFYNLNTGRVQRIPDLTGKNNYDLKEYSNGILKYDDKQIMLQF